MKLIPNIGLLTGCLVIFGLVFRVRGAGDLTKIDTLAKVKWPLYVLAALVVISLLVSLVLVVTKASSQAAKEKLRLTLDVASLVLVGACFWLIARM